MQRAPVTVSFSILVAIAAVLVGACCCDPAKKCIKDPPCRACENPCCLSPLQRKALEAGTHALNQPVVMNHEGKTVILLTEKGQTEWDKDKLSFMEKSVRSIKPTGTLYMDLNIGQDINLAEYVSLPAPQPK